MKGLSKVIVFFLILVLMAPVKSAFADYISDAVQALEEASVYVSPGTERTNQETASMLQSRLEKDDNIVLVMLPVSATAELGADPYTIAIRLSEALGDQRIVGVAVGNDVVGYAPTLPEGVASDLMRRADSVSNDPVTALITFTQNVHRWQVENPPPTPPVEIQSPEGWPWWVYLAITIVIILLGIAAGSFLLTTSVSEEDKGYDKVPQPAKDLLRQIAVKGISVHDYQLKSALDQMCADIKAYFQSRKTNEGEDLLSFNYILTEIDEILDTYLKVLKSERGYRDHTKLLQQGKEELIETCEFILTSIQEHNSEALTSYRRSIYALAARREMTQRE